jgi:hypothetical protein
MLITLLLLFPMLIGAPCDQATAVSAEPSHRDISGNTNSMNDTLLIKIGSKEFTATLLDNPTATAFKAMLPLTMNMTELNGNEKYFKLPQNIPTNESTPETIKPGDLMLWDSNTFVLFYESLSTSYSYTKLGKIDNPAGLASAVGSGNITVTIEIR